MIRGAVMIERLQSDRGRHEISTPRLTHAGKVRQEAVTVSV